MIAIDDFPLISDTCGHRCGDYVLIKVEAIINSALNGRGIVGRFGGDEMIYNYELDYNGKPVKVYSYIS